MKKKTNRGYEIQRIKQHTFGMPDKIVTVENYPRLCPQCFSRWEMVKAYIPLESEDKEATFPAAYCKRCGILYARKESNVREILLDNTKAKSFTLDGEVLWNRAILRAEKEQKERDRREWQKTLPTKRNKLSEIPSAEVLVNVRFADRCVDYIIVSKPEDEDGVERFHYDSWTGREILSAAFAKERAGKGRLKGQGYTVVNKLYPENGSSACPINRRICHSLRILPHGGYFVLEKYCPIVDVMLYSDSTNRYETIRTTYIPQEDDFFVDFALYREFVRKYGVSSVVTCVGWLEEGGFQTPWKDGLLDERGFNLREESLLRIYGYTVGKDDPGRKARQEILSDFVDCGIRTVKEIADFLTWLISTHSASKYGDACLKWADDREFIQKYKANPTGIFIAKN